MSLIEFIATRMRVLRRKHGLTQEQIAVMLGTDLKWYQRVEWRKKDVRASTIDRLASLFGITAVEFLAKDLPVTKIKSLSPGAPHRPRKAKPRRASGKAK